MLSSQRWEDRFGAILACSSLAKKAFSLTSDFIVKVVIEQKVPVLMSDPEFRVRNQIGSLLKAFLHQCDTDSKNGHFVSFKNILVDNIEQKFERD